MEQVKMTPEDEATLKDMFEKLEYFLKKYEGSGLALSSLLFYNGKQVDIQSRLQIVKMVKTPNPILQP